jgi:hypothetical protein
MAVLEALALHVEVEEALLVHVFGVFFLLQKCQIR